MAQLTCPGGQSCSIPLCPNTVVQYLCNIYVPGQFTRWTVPQCNIQLLQTDYCDNQSIQCGLFEASNVPPIGDLRCTTSILSVNIRPELNGSSIRCDSSNTTVQYFIGSATILVLGELQCHTSALSEQVPYIVLMLDNEVIKNETRVWWDRPSALYLPSNIG